MDHTEYIMHDFQTPLRSSWEANSNVRVGAGAQKVKLETYCVKG